MNRKSSQLATIVGWTLGAAATAGAVASYFISTWKLQHAPLAPYPAAGEIHPYFIRGTTIYLNSLDLAVESWLLPSMIVLGLLAGSILTWVQRNRGSS